MRSVGTLVVLATLAGCGDAAPVIDVTPGDPEDVLDGKADGDAEPLVEVKVTIDELDIRRARYRLSLRNDNSERREIWFYDTPWLEVFEAGALLRARKVSGGDDDSTIKLRPFAREDVDAAWFALDGFKCEIDRLLDRETSSCSLTTEQAEGEIDDVGDGDRAIVKLFSDEQEAFLDENGPAVDWDALRPLGPIPARVWKLRTDALPAKATAELWYLPDQTQVLELSMKIAVADGDDGLDALLDLLDSLDIGIDPAQETKTRRALELLAERE